MSEYSAKSLRDARAAKAKKMASADPHEKVDSSTWTPPDALNADVKTGMRPLSRRAFKSGGKVEGSCGAMRADKMPRKKSGGGIGIAMANKNMKSANEEREGAKHTGGLKSGGRAGKLAGGALGNMAKKPSRVAKSEKIGTPDLANKRQAGVQMAYKKLSENLDDRSPRKSGGRTGKMDGGPMMGPPADPRMGMVQPNRMKFAGPQGTPYKKGGAVHEDEAADKALIKKMVKPSARTAKAGGGGIGFGDYDSAPKKKASKSKDKTNINIVIAAGKPQQDGPPGMPPGGKPPMPPGPPPGPPPGAGGPPGMPPGMPPGPPPGAGGPPPGMPPMPRKSGGRITKVAKSYKDMEAGSASGEGRLQKTDIASRLPKPKEDGANVYEGLGYPNKVPGATGGRKAKRSGGSARSYKDMDAGAGSGEGRLEKTAIQHSKRGR